MVSSAISATNSCGLGRERLLLPRAARVFLGRSTDPFGPRFTHCDRGPASNLIRLPTTPRSPTSRTSASASLATFASRIILPSSEASVRAAGVPLCLIQASDSGASC